MENNEENSKFLNIVVETAKRCIGFNLLEMPTDEPMSIEEFQREMSKILPRIKLKCVNEFVKPNI